jgi:DNA-binding transcriptional regulator PaaX
MYGYLGYLRRGFIKTAMYKFGPVQQKMLLLLTGGIALGLQTSSLRYYKLLFALRKEWKDIDRRSVNRSLQRLSEQKLVEERESSDGSFRLVLTEEGKRQAKRLDLFGQSIRFRKPKKWDKKWRVVMFDIPEKSRTFRDILREHLREMEFYRLQKSVFVSPYPYEKPLAELTDLYGADPYVRILTVSWIDNEKFLKRHFFRPPKADTKAESSEK